LDWRLALFTLIVQYLAASLLFVDLLDPRLAIIKLFVGMFVCLILYMTARQVDYGRLPNDLTAAEAFFIQKTLPGHFDNFTQLTREMLGTPPDPPKIC